MPGTFLRLVEGWGWGVVVGVLAGAALAPSPLAEATLFIEPARMSPTANTPGRDSGHTTWRKASHLLEYRSFAASTRRLSIRSRATYKGSAVNGMKFARSSARSSPGP